MSIVDDLSGSGVPDIEGFQNVDAAVKNDPIMLNASEQLSLQQEELDPAVRQQLLNPNNPIKTMHDDVVSVHQMGELANEVAKKKAVSFHDAENVNLVFENFKNKFKVAEFTAFPSQVNLHELQKFVQTEVRLRQESIQASFQQFVLEPFGAVKDAYQKFNETTRDVVIQAVDSFAVECQEWLKDKTNVDEQTFVYGSDTINLATTPISKLPDDIVLPRGDGQLFFRAVLNLRKILAEDMHAKPLVTSITEPDDFRTDRWQVGSAEDLQNFVGKDFSAKDLIDFFANSALRLRLQQMREQADMSFHGLDEIAASFKGVVSEPKEAERFVIENHDAIQDTINGIHYCMEVHLTVRSLCVNMGAVLSFFKN